MARFMLDTNTVSYLLKNKSTKLAERLRSLPAAYVLCISSLTEAEVRFGFAKNSDARTGVRHFEQLLDLLDVLSWGRSEASVYGRVRARQQAMGRPLSPLDTLIAAHALAVEATLITSDRAFAHVDGLRAENWATDL